MLPFLFSAMTMRAVGRAAFAIVNEVRRQFAEIPGIMEGTGRPDYVRCVDISTRGALREMIIPGLMAVAAPLSVGFLLGEEALGGLLIGAVGSGLVLAITMANAGGAWDNAKKYIEIGHYGGKGSDAHKAAVEGDVVGDPFKDTSRALAKHPSQADGHSVPGIRSPSFSRPPHFSANRSYPANHSNLVRYTRDACAENISPIMLYYCELGVALGISLPPKHQRRDRRGVAGGCSSVVER